ncbi:MAG: hypothetical protein ACLQVI_28945 [Polyangiaceae bacterium]
MRISSLRSFRLAVLLGAGLFLAAVAIPACGSSQPQSFHPTADGGGTDTEPDGGTITLVPTFDGSVGNSDGSTTTNVCPTGLTCNVVCSGGGTTSVTGKVYDPAGKNPLYNVAVYVPAVPLTPLPKGVPTGAAACNCGALFESGAVVNTTTAVDGTFTLTNVPVGANVPLVLQVGKWRRQVSINVTQCTANAQPDKSLTLPGTVAAGDTNDNIPDIAVSTGEADTLECLMLRIGLPASEYVAGTGTTGHIHVFSGGSSGLSLGGKPETPAMAGAPASYTDLWSTQAQLMPYDIVLLSCEGGETYNANPPALEAYLNAGGRAFASHFHYAWFSGPLESLQSYSAPSDWGSNLATWTTDKNGGSSPIGGIIDQTLNGSTKPFPKGVALDQWLGDVSALGQNSVPATELSIYQPRYNATVAATNTPSQPWITSDSTGIAGATMYFSFDTPVNTPIPTDGGAPQYCGRAVFSDLHVAGNPTTNDTSPPPGGCDNVDLSPQEKALEFMLFDLSSCVIPDTSTVPTQIPPPPK